MSGSSSPTTSASDKRVAPQSRLGMSIAAWLLFSVGLLPYGYSLLTAIGEYGDPPYTANDSCEFAAFVAWLVLLPTAASVAVLSRRKISALMLSAVVALLVLAGFAVLL